MIRHFDREALKEEYSKAEPFPFVRIERFLDSAFASEVAASYPSFEAAAGQGFKFDAVNERKKIQICDAKQFPVKVTQLNAALASPEFLRELCYITSIPNLIADEELVGGGMHITGAGGRLDVHIDFNYLEERALHRRLNLLIYLNPVWESKWGGHIQLWDNEVKTCLHDFEPVLNRCVIFETSKISFHGVTPVTTAAPFPRISFATYYYTREAPSAWDGAVHSTVFKARPEEKVREYFLMPAEKFQRRLSDGARRIKRGIRKLIQP